MRRTKIKNFIRIWLCAGFVAGSTLTGAAQSGTTVWAAVPKLAAQTVDTGTAATQASTGAATQANAGAASADATTITLGFAGDINFADDHPTIQYLEKNHLELTDVISPNILELTQSEDLFMINNEFTYSKRGAPLPGKAYTFRAAPEKEALLDVFGTDLVLLANNHVWDFGEDAFLDTLSTLEGADMPYVGAGRNLDEAMKPLYMDVKGVRIAYVAASRAEKYKMTPEATDTTPGILRTYDETKFLEVVREAAQHADYVIASVHWGTEYDNHANKTQRALAREIIDAGADAIVGSHPHVIQGIEYYKGCPILYSLGNFWFNGKTLYSCVYELTLEVDPKGKAVNATAKGPAGNDVPAQGKAKGPAGNDVPAQAKTADSAGAPKAVSLSQVRFVPCIQKGYRTTWPEDNPKLEQKILDFEEDLSFNAVLDEEGIVTEVK